MSEQDKDEQQFWQLTEELLELANTRLDNYDAGLICSALMQASSRFNAFYVAASSESKAELIEDKQESVERFAREYKRQFAQSLEDYIENYKVYLKQES